MFVLTQGRVEIYHIDELNQRNFFEQEFTSLDADEISSYENLCLSDSVSL